MEFPNSKSRRVSDCGVPWQRFTQHRWILSLAEDLDERLFYIKRASHEHYRVEDLKRSIRNDDYHHQGQIPNNFLETMPSSSRALRAIEAFKDAVPWAGDLRHSRGRAEGRARSPAQHRRPQGVAGGGGWLVDREKDSALGWRRNGRQLCSKRLSRRTWTICDNLLRYAGHGVGNLPWRPPACNELRQFCYRPAARDSRWNLQSSQSDAYAHP